MNGLSTEKSVIIMAATDRPEILDAALTRARPMAPFGNGPRLGALVVAREVPVPAMG